MPAGDTPPTTAGDACPLSPLSYQPTRPLGRLPACPPTRHPLSGSTARSPPRPLSRRLGPSTCVRLLRAVRMEHSDRTSVLRLLCLHVLTETTPLFRSFSLPLSPSPQAALSGPPPALSGPRPALNGSSTTHKKQMLERSNNTVAIACDIRRTRRTSIPNLKYDETAESHQTKSGGLAVASDSTTQLKWSGRGIRLTQTQPLPACKMRSRSLTNYYSNAAHGGVHARRLTANANKRHAPHMHMFVLPGQMQAKGTRRTPRCSRSPLDGTNASKRHAHLGRESLYTRCKPLETRRDMPLHCTLRAFLGVLLFSTME